MANIFDFGCEPQRINDPLERWGSYVITDLSVDDDALIETISGCLKALIAQHRETAKRENLEIVEESMEFIIKKNPDWFPASMESLKAVIHDIPTGTVGMKYIAWRKDNEQKTISESSTESH